MFNYDIFHAIDILMLRWVNITLGEITLKVSHFCSKEVMYNKYYSA
jgi:hypothetical protein